MPIPSERQHTSDYGRLTRVEYSLGHNPLMHELGRFPVKTEGSRSRTVRASD